MARAGPTNPNLHFVAEDASTMAPDKFKGHLLLSSILRRQVFHDELEMPEALFEYAEADYNWRHVFAQKGDAPLGYLRWKAELNPATHRAIAAVFDMLCVTSRARREGIATQLLAYCITEVAVRLQDPSEFVGIFVVVPRHATRAHVAHTFVKLGFQFVPHEAALPPGVPRANPEHELVMLCTLETVGKITETWMRHTATVQAAQAAAAGPAPVVMDPSMHGAGGAGGSGAVAGTSAFHTSHY